MEGMTDGRKIIKIGSSAVQYLVFKTRIKLILQLQMHAGRNIQSVWFPSTATEFVYSLRSFRLKVSVGTLCMMNVLLNKEGQYYSAHDYHEICTCTSTRVIFPIFSARHGGTQILNLEVCLRVLYCVSNRKNLEIWAPTPRSSIDEYWLQQEYLQYSTQTHAHRHNASPTNHPSQQPLRPARFMSTAVYCTLYYSLFTVQYSTIQ